MPTRREFLIGCGSLAAGTLVASGLGASLYAIKERKDFETAVSATEEWFRYAMTQTATNVAKMQDLGMTPTPLASRVADIVTQNPTAFPTLTLTPSSTPSTVATETPPPQIKIITETPQPTLTSEEKQKIKEGIMIDRETAWDAARSLPPIVTVNSLAIWMAMVSTDVALDIVEKGDLSAYEELVEVVGGDLKNPNLEFLNNAFLSDSINKGKTLDQRQAWVYSRPTNDGKDREFPKAYESKQVLIDQVRDALRQGWGEDPTENEVKRYYKNLVNQLFVIQEGKNPEDTILLARNSFRAHTKSGKRQDQPQRDICSVYRPDVEIGKEYIKNGILYLSNKVPFQFTAFWSKEPIKVDDPQRGANLAVKSRDGKTILGYIFIRVQDQGSLPKDALFGITGVPEPIVGKTGPWMSIVGTSCGPAAPKPTPTSKPEVVQEQPQPSQPEQPKPPQPKTEIPPTNIPTQPLVPTKE